METKQWYYVVEGRQEGPVAEDSLARLFQTRQLPPDTLVWNQELTGWVQASTIPGLAPAEVSPPPIPPVPAPGTSYAPPLPVSYAGFWQRVAATLIDLIICSVGGGIVGGIVGMVGTAGAFGILVAWLYSALMESSSHQATVGKMALSIKVTDLRGRRISFARATGRHFGKYLSALVFGIGYLMVAFTGRKQGLHDLMADTLVVNS